MKIGDITLTDLQSAVIPRLKSGNILLGGVGSGKTYTSIAWAYNSYSFRKIYVITTASNRNRGEWHKSLEQCGIENYEVDSWNNIGKYVDVKDAVFIFDEQRVVGYGKWSKYFIQIAWNNAWILTTATPGDTYMEYIPVLVANKFYRNKSHFVGKHVVWNAHVKYPLVERYIDTDEIQDRIDQITVPMDVVRHTRRNYKHVWCDWDPITYRERINTRFNPEANKPIETAAELTLLLRKTVGSTEDRQNKALNIMQNVDRLIVFYNYTWELEILRELAKFTGKPAYEYNGKQHDLLPTEDKWLYFVQYNAGAEGWNCITTDSIMFYSANHSYKKMEQAYGRIDRMNTPYTDLHYYILTSQSPIDKAMLRSLSRKKTFNSTLWAKNKYMS